jgi:tripartite-type tricarboxylate transporter receptor subunit TctC
MFKQSMRETMRKHSGRAPAVTASTPTRRRFLHLAAGAVAFPAVSRITRAHAQVYPNKLIKMILPYTAGSPNDVLARLVTPGLSSQLGQTVVIDNRPGGGTSIGTRVVMTAEPDGYTLLWAASPSHFIIPYVSKTFTYDPLKDFLPIASVGTNSNVLVIVPSVPAKTLPELIAYAKANPGKLSFAFGQGTPYRGGAQAVTDMLGGHIHMNFGSTSTLLPLIRDGRVRALAVSSAVRTTDLPEVPTMIESGFPNVGILGLAGPPANVVNRINNSATESLKSPELIANMAKAGFEPKSGSPQDFASLLAAEMRKWLPIVTTSGLQIE